MTITIPSRVQSDMGGELGSAALSPVAVSAPSPLYLSFRCHRLPRCRPYRRPGIRPLIKTVPSYRRPPILLAIMIA